jgi:hypothetical protein
MISTGIAVLDMRYGGGATTGVHMLASNQHSNNNIVFMNLAIAAAIHGENVLYVTADGTINTTLIGLRCLASGKLEQDLVHRPAFEWTPAECRSLCLINPDTVPLNRIRVCTAPRDPVTLKTAVQKWQDSGSVNKSSTHLVVLENADLLQVEATAQSTQDDIRLKVTDYLCQLSTDTDTVLWTGIQTKCEPDGNVISGKIIANADVDVLIGVTVKTVTPDNKYQRMTFTELLASGKPDTFSLWVSPTGKLWQDKDSAIAYDRLNGVKV